MTSRRPPHTTSLVLALSLTAAASCSSSLPVNSVSLSGDQRIPRGVTTQLMALASTAGGRIVHDVTASATWTSSDPSIASVTGGAVRGVSPGTVKITAATGGVSGTLDLTVSEGTLLSIDVGPPFTLAAGVSKHLSATGTYSDLTTRDLTSSVTWTTSTPPVATVSSGLVASVAPGTATIRATDPATGIAGSTVVTVSPAQLASVAITPDRPSVPLGTKQQFTATGTYTDATTQDITSIVNWSSSVLSVASVSTTGAATGLASTAGLGTTTISATEPASGLSSSTALTVTAARLTSLAITPPTPSIALGAKQQFTAIGKYTDATSRDLTGTVAWEASNPAVAQVSNAAGSSGLATSTGVGSATIKATEASSAISATATLTVTTAQLVSIAVTPAAQSVPSGLTVQFTATGTYTDASTQVLNASVTWSSSTSVIASISNASGSRGVATAGVVGTTTIAAVDPATQITGSTTLTVTSAQLVSIAITPSSPSVPLGLTKQFAATGTYTNGTTEDLTSTVTWSSSAPAVATLSNAVSSKGLATTASVGTTTVSAVDPATKISGSTTLTVTGAQLVSVAVAPASPSISAGQTQQFAATGTYSDSSTVDLTTTVTWSSSATNVASISNASGSNGLATAAASVSGTSTATITAAVPGTSPPINGTATLTVTP